jgi:hypothetical protein
MRWGLAAAILGLLLAAGACTNTYRLEDSAGASLIVDAKDRVVLTKRRSDGTLVVCAEPYPDLGGATNVDASLSGGATIPAAAAAPIPGSLQGNATASLKTVETLMALGARTAGVNVLRDFAYRACEAYLNNAIDGRQYDLILLASAHTIAAVMALDGMREIEQPQTPTEMREIVEELSDIARFKMRLSEPKK